MARRVPFASYSANLVAARRPSPLACQARYARLQASPAAVGQFQHVRVFLEPFRSRPAHIVHLGTIVIGERFCDLVPQIRNSGAERADPFDQHGHDGHRDVAPANMVSAAVQIRDDRAADVIGSS